MTTAKPKVPPYRTCLELGEWGKDSLPIKVEQRGMNGRFRVTYGLQVKEGLTYVQAAHELGECIFHALACNSKLGNEGP